MQTHANSVKPVQINAYEMVDIENKRDPTVNPPDIKWMNLNFAAGKASILTNCWGKVNSGEVCAIMGPSGAGKSSLLNVLAGRSSSAAGLTIEGKIFVGGKIINPVAFRKHIAYVMQEDALLATATPREALTFSANLKLPSSVPTEKIHELVEGLLEELGLLDCANVMIGGPLIKGISGGQKKRTSVGVELITQPQLLFLDEPTSGLDSYSAFSLVVLLKKVAKQNCTVLCTIHQPSSEIFFLFDTVIFMKRGRIFYQGPVTEIVSRFETLGFTCPSNYNPSDYIMNLCQTVADIEAEEKKLFMDCPASMIDSQESVKLVSEVHFTTESSSMKQLRILTHRDTIRTVRDVGALVGRFGVTIVLSLLYGLIFLGVGGKDDGVTSNFANHYGAIAMVAISCLFGSAWPMMLSFPFERPMFLREYSTGTYDASAYFISKLLVEIIIQFLQTIVMFLLVYFLIDFQGSFIYEVLIGFGLGMAANSVAIALGCTLPDVKTVTEFSPLLLVPQMLFIGLFVKTSEIPIFLRWAQYLCSLKYAMNLMILVEFDTSNPNCTKDEAAAANCSAVASDNDVVKDDYYVYIILLFILFLAFRLIGAIILVQKAKKFY